MSSIFTGIMISFIGTTVGTACVFFLEDALKPSVQKTFLGFASGVVVAVSVRSLLIPSVGMSEHMGKLAFIPASVDFLLGIGFLFLLNEIIPHLHIDTEQPEGPKSDQKKGTILALVVTLHNIPEGMAVGVAFARLLSRSGTITMVGTLALSVGIAMQSFPEGAIISLPLKEAAGKGKTFIYGAFSGVVEPVGALSMLVLAEFLGPALPYFLSFATGAMIYVVVEELIPESTEGEHSDVATIEFAVGFVVMMILDVTLGQDVLGFGNDKRNTIKRKSITKTEPHLYPE